jgi:hypothetical protein
VFAVLFDGPIITLAVAATAASVPIVIHLLNRNRYRVMAWAAMRFLVAAERKHSRRMRLEQMLLLALRTLMVVLLVAAMAGVMPWAAGCWGHLFGGASFAPAAGRPRTHKILVLDGSLSMALKVGEESCWDRARARAVRLLQSSSGGDGFSVLLMASPPRRIVADPSDDAHKVAEEIQGLRLPHGNAAVGATLKSVEELLQHSPEKYPEREVYFFTDLQRSTWISSLGVDSRAALQRIQGMARSIVVDVGVEGANNLAVTSLTLGVPVATTGSMTPITATIHNFGNQPFQQVRLELRVGKARAVAGDPTFAFQPAQQQFVDLTPGQSATVSFSYKFSAPGSYAIQVGLEPDSLELDDTRTAVVQVKESMGVLLVNGKPAVELLERATEWLHDALNPYESGTPAHPGAIRPRVIGESQFADAGLGDLTPYDCVYLCDVARVGPSEIRRLEMHLRQGGGVVFCLGPHVDLEAYNRLLYRNGEGLLPARLLGLQTAPPRRYFALFAEEDRFKQPPLDAFASDRDRASLLGARFREYVRTELPSQGQGQALLSFIFSGSTSPESANDLRPGISVADLPGSEPALVAVPRYRGRVLLLTTTANMDWTSWPISPSYPAFMQELLRYAVAGRLREQALGVGDVLEEYLPVSATGQEVTVKVPQGSSETTRILDREDAALLRWSDTEISGLYRAIVSNSPQEYLFAVNPPTASESQQGSESDLTRTDEHELRSAYGPWDFQLVHDLEQVVHETATAPKADDAASGSQIGSAIARYLLLIMLLLTLVEIVFAWRLGHPGGPKVVVGPVPSKRIPAIALGAVLGIVFLALGIVLAHAAWTGDFLGFLPAEMRRQAESALGVPAAVPGEGSHWRLEYQPYLRDAASDPWLVGSMALLIAFAVVLIYLHEARTAGFHYRLLLAGLRLGFIALILMVFLPQLRLLFERQSLPDIAILIDDSRSMSTRDQYQDARVQKAADNLIGQRSSSNPERLQLAQALLTSAQPDWLERILSRNQMKVHLYSCSTGAVRLAEVTDAVDPEPRAKAVAAIRGLKAEGESSQLGRAVRQVLNDFRGSSLAAVIMLTDGVTTEGEDLVRAGSHAAKAGVPLFFVGLGEAQGPRDLRLQDLQVEDTVYVHDRLVFEGRLTGPGYAGSSIPVTLREKGNPKILDTQWVKLDAAGRPAKVRLAHRPSTPGEKTYILEATEPANAASVSPARRDDNSGPSRPDRHHQLERTVLVREMKLIKVLYVEGYARYEYRFLKNLLERESAQDPNNKSMDLKVLLLDADGEYAQVDKSAIPDFPNKAELNQFDLILFGDVDPTDPRVEKNLPLVADFVRERGGGFLMIAGERFSPQHYAGTPLQAVLPVEPMAPAAERDRSNGFRPELTVAGQFHPLFRFRPDEGENRKIWERLPEIYWWSEGYRAKPGAEILAVHPHQGARSSEKGPGEHHPLILQEYVGAGRSLFYGIDETWRWRYRADEVHYNQFWIQTIRYLARSRLGRVQLRLDREPPYRRGEPIKLMVRFPEEAPAPDGEVKVLVERRQAREDEAPELESQTLKLAKVEGSRGTYEAVLTRTPEGEYQFALTAPPVSGPQPKVACRVLPPPGEMEQLQMNQGDMQRAAEASRGHFYTLADADELLDALPAGTRVTLTAGYPPPQQLLWNDTAFFLLALITLAGEWFLRKQRHLV